MEIKLSKFWEHICNPPKDEDEMIFSQYLNCLKNRVVILNDRIDDYALEKITIPLMAMDNDGSGEPIIIIVNTCGGYLGSGFSIVHVIEHLKTPTTVFLIGEALSMGLYIAMAGYNNPNVKTVCTPYTRAMYHEAYLAGEIDSDDESLLKFQKEYDKTVIYNYIVTHSKITTELLDKWEGKEKYFTAKELKDFGIAEIEQ